MRFFFVLLALISIGISSSAAQKVQVGEIRDYHWQADSSGADGPELILEKTISVPGAGFLKPHFARLRLAAGESLTILDGNGAEVEVLMGRGPRAGAPFWGLSVAGDRLKIVLRLHSEIARHPVKIDRMAVGDAAALAAARSPTGSGGQIGQENQKSLCGAADFEDAFCYQGDAAKWTNTLATTGILTAENGSVFWCSGVNVSPRNLILTTQSCLPATADCLDAEFVFGYYRDGCGDSSPIAAGWQGYRCQETVASSPFGNICEPTPSNLDFSLHQAEGDPASDWGWADPDSTPLISGERLYMPQHADGRPLEITHGEGADVEVDGMTLRYYGTLDTESSSVGAPLFRDSDDRLVALHHCGGCASPGVGNRGVLMADIRPQIASFLCQPSLLLEAAPAGVAIALSGNGDGVLDPGETWQITPKIRNVACATSTTNVAASFQVAAGSVPMTLLDTSSSFGTVASGETASGTPIRFILSHAAACAGEATIELASITSDGGPFSGEPAYFSAALGEVPETTLLSESFDLGLPLSWTLLDGGSSMGGDATWSADDPGDRQLFPTPFVIVDSEFLGPGETMDEQLITPMVNTSAPTHVTLRFQHHFRYWAEGLDEQADVDVRSSATAGAWVNLARYQDADTAGQVSLDLTAQQAADLEVRFRYSQAEWEWWWALDDIEIVGDDGRVCTEFLFLDGFETGDTSAWTMSSP